MEIEEFEKLLSSQMQELKIELNKSQIRQFYKYMELLISWNQKINLTAITEPAEIIQKHFVDSATIVKHLKDVKTLIDVGTGAGFPGVPIKILMPEIKITLIDSLNKRIMFLEELFKELNIENIEAIHMRAEEAGKNKKYREQYDVVVSRAVANMSTLAEYTLPLVKLKGKAIYMKGPEIDKELEQSQKAVNVLGGTFEKVEHLNLPNSDIKRNNIIIDKIRQTPTKYPRKPGDAKKMPIS